jgi:hypothetical protein
MMRYDVECQGIRRFTSYSLKDAKAAVRARLAAED